MKQMKINVAGQESVFDYNKIAHNTQEELVSGENLKTVNQNTLLGSGDVPIEVEGGIIVEAAANKTVNGLIVPDLSDDQLHAIYNATLAGKSVTITDATGMMHFTGVTADTVSDEVFVSFVYFDKMVLEYGEGGATTFKEVGGSKVAANPTLSGSEAALTGLDIDGIKYAAGGGKYKYIHVFRRASMSKNVNCEQFTVTVLSNVATPISTADEFRASKIVGWSYNHLGFSSSSSGKSLRILLGGNNIYGHDYSGGSIAHTSNICDINWDTNGALTSCAIWSSSTASMDSIGSFTQTVIEL